MKNYITVAAFLAAGTAFANATEWTVDNSVDTTVSNFWANGFVFNLGVTDNSRLEVIPSTSELDALVYLSSVDVNIRAISDATLQTGTGVTALSLVLCDKDFNIVSVSSNEVSTTGNVTWNFENATVSTKAANYLYYIDSANADVAKAAIGSVITEVDTTKDWLVSAGASSLIKYNNTSGLLSLAFIGSNQTVSYNDVNSVQYAPKVSLTLTSVPEPSAFGLLAGLGALALVGARRRRR